VGCEKYARAKITGVNMVRYLIQSHKRKCKKPEMLTSTFLTYSGREGEYKAVRIIK
jgi:hypothetical protein